MALSLMRYRRLLGDEDAGPVVPLDHSLVRARSREDERFARLIEQEKQRLSAMQRYERRARKLGYGVVAGVDEVGRGPLAGPLVAAAVIFDGNPWIPILNDSKKLDFEEREALHDVIRERARGVGIGVVTVPELNVSNIHRATLLAMTRALQGLGASPQCVLVDGKHKIPDLCCEQWTVVKGDALSISIAAASIVAKVTRDRVMIDMDAAYPAYGFARHKGYSTSEHLDALRREGPSPIHRRLFAPVHAALGGDGQLELFDLATADPG